MKTAPACLSARFLRKLEAVLGARVARYGFSTGLAGTRELAIPLLVALAVGRGRGPVHHFHRWWNA